jgi:hypothetical protein
MSQQTKYYIPMWEADVQKLDYIKMILATPFALHIYTMNQKFVWIGSKVF